VKVSFYAFWLSYILTYNLVLRIIIFKAKFKSSKLSTTRNFLIYNIKPIRRIGRGFKASNKA